MRSLTRIAVVQVVIGAALITCVSTQTTTSNPIPQDAISRIDAYAEDLVRDGAFSGSVLVAQGDTVLLSAGYGMADLDKKVPNTPQTGFHIGSVTKQFTARAVLILHSQGEIDLEEQVCSYIPDCPDHWKEITIHQLLTHSPGLPDSWDFYADRNRPDVSYDPGEIIG